MKNITNIIAAVIIIISTSAVTAGTSSFNMLTATGQEVEVVSQNEILLNEETPNHIQTINEYVSEKVKVREMPRYNDKVIEEETFASQSADNNTFEVESFNLNIESFIKEEAALENELRSIETRVVLKEMIESKNNQIVIADFKSVEKETNENTFATINTSNTICK